MAHFFRSYDANALAPIEAPDPLADPAQVRLLATLRAWALTGITPGCSPLLAPWAPPEIARRFDHRTLDELDQAQGMRLACTLARDLAGFGLLEGRGALARLLVRLKIVAIDLLWFRRREPSDVWDEGMLDATDSARLARLSDWQPRRPTLLVLDDPSGGQARGVIELLQQRCTGFRNPVRLLVISSPQNRRS